MAKLIHVHQHYTIPVPVCSSFPPPIPSSFRSSRKSDISLCWARSSAVGASLPAWPLSVGAWFLTVSGWGTRSQHGYVTTGVCEVEMMNVTDCFGHLIKLVWPKYMVESRSGQAFFRACVNLLHTSNQFPTTCQLLHAYMSLQVLWDRLGKAGKFQDCIMQFQDCANFKIAWNLYTVFRLEQTARKNLNIEVDATKFQCR